MSGKQEIRKWVKLTSSSVSEKITGCVLIEFQYQR
jgi:hypothetical protein